MIKKYFEVLLRCALFEGILQTELASMLSCLNGRVQVYPKNSMILMAQEAVSVIGVILSGRAQVIKQDYSGHQLIVAEVLPSEIFAETFACAGITKSPVTVLSVTECEVLFVDYNKVISVCPSACGFHTLLIENLLKQIAVKNILLNQKIEFISMRTIREKLLSYFAAQRQKTNSRSFVIPFSRQELADFLCVDRSSLSRELCKMRDDGLLAFHGNKFEMLKEMPLCDLSEL